MTRPARPARRTVASPATLARLDDVLAAGPLDVDELSLRFTDATVLGRSAEQLEAILWSYPERYRLDRADRWFRLDLGPVLDPVRQHCCPRGQAAGVPVCPDCSPTQTHR